MIDLPTPEGVFIRHMDQITRDLAERSADDAAMWADIWESHIGQWSAMIVLALALFAFNITSDSWLSRVTATINGMTACASVVGLAGAIRARRESLRREREYRLMAEGKD